MGTRILCVGVLLLVPATVLGAKAPEVLTILHLDLATETNSTETVKPGTYAIQIDNLVPNKLKDYTVVISQELIPIPPLAFPVKTKGGVEEGLPQVCQDFRKNLDALEGATLEAEAAEAQRGLNDLLADAIKENCPASDLRQADRLMARMVWGPTKEPYGLRPGERLQVTVTRNDGSRELKWVKVWTTGTVGEWMTSYGFTFVPDRGEKYFSKPTGSGNQYVVTPMHDNGGLEFIPAVFFTWFPNSTHQKAWVLGGTAGLGFNLNTPALFGGASLMYHRNVQLVLGAAINQQARLNGQYSSGQTITENLSSDQLSSEAYRLNVFFGLTFRFETNPFESSAPSAGKAPASVTQPKS